MFVSPLLAKDFFESNLPSCEIDAEPTARPVISLKFSQALSLRLRTSTVTFDISWALRLNNSSPYSVNTRGAGEVPSFRLSKSIEGVAEVVFPPLFKVNVIRLARSVPPLFRRPSKRIRTMSCDACIFRKLKCSQPQYRSIPSFLHTTSHARSPTPPQPTHRYREPPVAEAQR